MVSLSSFANLRITDMIEYRDVRAMKAPKDKAGREGPSLHAVRYCEKCLTTWNRDVNAARNIAIVFWYQRFYGGKRPLGYRRLRKPNIEAVA